MLNLQFENPALPPGLSWHCEPKQWSVDTAQRQLVIATDAGTDFWQRTHYGFERDDGHFLHLPVIGDFVATTRVTAAGHHQYDQAGLMLRLSATCWVKTSVEFEPEEPSRLGAVVTNGGYSDWSTQAVPKELKAMWFRIELRAADCTVLTSIDGTDWQQIRVAHLAERTMNQPVSCGLYACSPKAAGFEARFAFLEINRLG